MAEKELVLRGVAEAIEAAVEAYAADSNLPDTATYAEKEAAAIPNLLEEMRVKSVNHQSSVRKMAARETEKAARAAHDVSSKAAMATVTGEIRDV